MQPQPPSTPQHAPATQQPTGEEVLYHGPRRHSASWWAYTKWTAVIVFGTVLGALLRRVEFFAAWPMWLLGVVGIPGIFYAYLEHITTRYKITPKRVELERGVISKSVDSLELWRVLDVRYKQTFVDRILGNATITLIGTDRTDPELAMHGLPNDRHLFEKLRDAVQAARMTGRPMELVGQDGGFEHVGHH